MKQETFDKAIMLDQKIKDYENAISHIEGKGGPCHKAIGLSFFYASDMEETKGVVLLYLNKKLSKLKKDFSNLK